MKFKQCFIMAWNMVTHSRLRSWLTIIGIIIGVASIIALVSIGDGMSASINEELGSLGGNSITVTPGYSKAGGFSPPGMTEEDLSNSDAILGRNDLQALKGIIELEYIDTRISGKAEVYYLGDNADLSITGVDQNIWSNTITTELLEGRYLISSDQNVVVIGNTLAKDYFDEKIGVNQIITIDEKSFRVVGILDDESKSIIMPINSAYQVIEDKIQDQYDSFSLIIKDNADIDKTIEKIERKLNIVRHVNTLDDKDFSVTSMKEMQEQINSVIGMITLFLGFVAAISLLVGSVGVANSMFTSVLEKTKEIGIMKAIGARNKDVLTIFMLNAGLVGIVGGIIGVLFGILISILIGGLLSGGTGPISQTVISYEIVILSLTVSVLVGIVAGAIPAYQGSKQKPVDALRAD